MVHYISITEALIVVIPDYLFSLLSCNIQDGSVGTNEFQEH